MILVDTGYFIALADLRDQHHTRAEIWSRACQEPLLVTEYVLWETINALSEGLYRPSVRNIMDAVRTDPQFNLLPATSQLFEKGLALHLQRPDKDWSLTDCISFEVMQSQQITQALTYDHHFIQAGFEALLRRDPA